MFDLRKFLKENKLTKVSELNQDQLDSLQSRFNICFESSEPLSINKVRGGGNENIKPSRPGWYIWYAIDGDSSKILSRILDDPNADKAQISGRVCYVGQAKNLRNRFQNNAGYIATRPDIPKSGTLDWKGSRYPINSDKLKSLIPIIITYYPEYFDVFRGKSFRDWIKNHPDEDLRSRYDINRYRQSAGNTTYMKDLLSFIESDLGVERSSSNNNPEAKEIYKEIKEAILNWMNDHIFIKFITLKEKEFDIHFIKSTKNREIVEGYLADQLLGDLITSVEESSWCVNLDDMRNKGSLDLDLGL